MIFSTETGIDFKLSLNQKNEWIKYVNRAAEYDFYHTWHYHTLAKEGEAILYIYTEEENFIAIPLLKRAIPNSNYFDLHSVYGFTGPISNIPYNEIREDFIENFKGFFLEFLKKENFVSIFSRLHPFFNQPKIIEKFGGLFDNGKTVAIDLQQPLEMQLKKFRACSLKAIRNCRNLGFELREQKTQQEIAAFAAIYQENMKRINAHDFYLFDEQYFTRLIQTDQYNCKLLLIYNGDEIVSGSVTMFTKGIIQAYLMGTKTTYLCNSPAKFLVNEICLLGRSLGMKYFNLGGGLGFKEDSLYDWKRGFSDLILDYKSWRYIVDPAKYNSMVLKSGNQNNYSIDFFPLYRA